MVEVFYVHSLFLVAIYLIHLNPVQFFFTFSIAQDLTFWKVGFLNFDVSCFSLRFYIFIDFESSPHNYLYILLCVIQNTNVGICYFTNYLMSSF